MLPSSQEHNAAPNLSVIQDVAERDAYVAARNEPDPVKRAAMSENFIFSYPDSIVLVDAFELALGTYEKLDHEHRADPAPLLANIDQNNILALAVLVFRGRIQVSTMGPKSLALAESCARAHKGIQSVSVWQKPHNLSEDQYAKLRGQAAGIFYGMAGFCAWLNKNYEEARSYYLKSAQFDPYNIANLGELGFADLQMNPIDVTGFWYAARSVVLARKRFGGTYAPYPYPEIIYEDYHGSREGWEEIVAQAATQTAPPPGFTVRKGRTPKPR